MAFKAKRYSTSFKVVLAMLVLIMAGYAFQVLTTGTKQNIVADTETDTVAITRPIIKHKKKHRIKKQVMQPVAVIPADTQNVVKITKVDPVKTPVIVARAQPAATIKAPTTVPVADSVKTNHNYLYTAYVQPNITGIIKLRAQDKFNSDVLVDIPARSAVQVLAKGPTYYKVVYNNAVGYVPKWALNIR